MTVAEPALGRRPWSASLILLLAVGSAGCGDAARASSSPRTEGRRASLERALSDFRRGLPTPAELSGGERSRDALVRRFLAAVERQDTNDVRGMLVTRAEFAHLYYPTSPFAVRQQAGLWWFLNMENSRVGITRTFSRLGGKPLRYVSHHCRPPAADGANLTHDYCRVTFAVRGDTSTVRLFGSILERDGRYKFMGFGNDF
jgi:hypothetical protein